MANRVMNATVYASNGDEITVAVYDDGEIVLSVFAESSITLNIEETALFKELFDTAHAKQESIQADIDSELEDDEEDNVDQ
jgi:hypothetical protein